jgi:hypothetical protein
MVNERRARSESDWCCVCPHDGRRIEAISGDGARINAGQALLYGGIRKKEGGQWMCFDAEQE